MSAEGPSDETPKCQRRPGRPRRPRKYPLLVHPTDVFITVEGPESVACSVHHKSCSCIVRIPNLLINHWNQLKEEGDTRSYISFANDAIIGQIVTLDIDSDRLENCLRIRASQLQNQLRCSNSSTTIEKLLQKDSLVQVLKGETLSCADIMKERDLARESAKEFQEKAEGLQSAMDELYMEMGEDIARYLEVIDDQQKEVAASKQQLAGCQTPVCNTGKKIDEVSPRHARRKLATFRNLFMQALWFGESFGLVPESLKVRKETSGVTQTIPLCEGTMQKNVDTTISAATASDKENVLQILYLLDRFGVSDLFYHELAMVNLSLPRLHWSIPIFQSYFRD